MRKFCNVVAFLAASFSGVFTYGHAHAGSTGSIWNNVAVCDPNAPNNCIVPNSNGELTITGTFSATASQQSTAAAPSYTEGTLNFLSGDLAGNLRTTLGTALPAGTNNIGTVVSAPLVGTYTSKNGSMTAGGTAQQLMASNTSRKRFYVNNPCSAAGQGIGAAESLYISFTGTAGIDDGSSFELAPCASFDSGPGPVTSQAVSVNATTIGHKFVAGEM